MKYNSRNVGLTEKQIEEGLTKAKWNKSYYSYLFMGLLFLNFMCVSPAVSAVSMFFYEPQYLCYDDDTKEFSKECKPDFVCDHTINIDYKEDPANVNLQSFIDRYDIYCNRGKVSTLNMAYFLGALVSVISFPFMVTYIGLILTLHISNFIFVISSIILTFSKTYWLGFIFYMMFSMGYTFCLHCIIQYVIEMLKPKYRSIGLGFILLAQPISGYICLLISHSAKNFIVITIVVGILNLLIGVANFFFLVDSVRVSFMRGDQALLIRNLRYIAKTNKSSEELDDWLQDNDINEVNNIKNKKNKFEDINYINIWKYHSQIPLIILFCIVLFINNYNLLIVQLELKREGKYWRSLAIAYTCDFFGIIVGLLLPEINLLKRKLSFSIINGALFLFDILYASTYGHNYLLILILLRLFVYALFINHNLYYMELLNTMCRPVESSIFRIFSRLFNIWTPYLMNGAPRAAFIFAAVIEVAIIFLLFFFKIEETKDTIIKEFPPEIEEAMKKKEEERESSSENNEEDSETNPLKNERESHSNESDENSVKEKNY